MSEQYWNRADRKRISKSPGIARCFCGRGRASYARPSGRDVARARKMTEWWNMKRAKETGRMPPRDRPPVTAA